MYSRTVRTGAFALESLNSIAMVYYFFYLFFFMKERFAFGDQRNLLLMAFTGGVYMVAAIYGGRFGQRRGYFAALKAGYALMIVSMIAGGFADTVTGQVLVLGVATVGMCFLWPNLEGIVCEGAGPRQTQRMVGIYNLVWATSNAVAYFTGGAMIETLGERSIFFAPAALHVAQLALAAWLERRAARDGTPAHVPATEPDLAHVLPNPRPVARARAFVRMAWIANPLAYLAMSTVYPVIPALADQLQLSKTMAGVFCSVWQFARAGTFLWLWLWPAWHYRFGWLAAAGATMVGGYALILLTRDLWMVFAAQLVFGFGVGLIYYSSLYYAMDTGEAKGEQGGIHEAAIGAGNCVGPLIGAAAWQFLPAHPAAGAVAVSVVLGAGCAVVAGVYRRYQSA